MNPRESRLPRPRPVLLPPSQDLPRRRRGLFRVRVGSQAALVAEHHTTGRQLLRVGMLEHAPVRAHGRTAGDPLLVESFHATGVWHQPIGEGPGPRRSR